MVKKRFEIFLDLRLVLLATGAVFGTVEVETLSGLFEAPELSYFNV